MIGLSGGIDSAVVAIARSIAVKARIVEDDERDHGRRRALNYGHTIGHAIEIAHGSPGTVSRQPRHLGAGRQEDEGEEQWASAHR